MKSPGEFLTHVGIEEYFGVGTAASKDVCQSFSIQSCCTHMLFHPLVYPELLDSSLGSTNLWD